MNKPTRFICEALCAQDRYAVGIKMLCLRQTADGIKGIRRHCTARVNFGNEVSEQVVLTECLGIYIVASGSLHTGTIAFGF